MQDLPDRHQRGLWFGEADSQSQILVDRFLAGESLQPVCVAVWCRFKS